MLLCHSLLPALMVISLPQDVKKILLDDVITAQVVHTYEDSKTLNGASRSKVVLPVAKALLKISIK